MREKAAKITYGLGTGFTVPLTQQAMEPFCPEQKK